MWEVSAYNTENCGAKRSKIRPMAPDKALNTNFFPYIASGIYLNGTEQNGCWVCASLHPIILRAFLWYVVHLALGEALVQMNG